MANTPRSVIVRCIEESTSAPPKTLREVGVDRVSNRQILSWSNHCGTYGMGGPGFFGLELAGNEVHGSEYLVLTLWGADEWLLLDDRWLAAHPRYYGRSRPLFSNFPKTFGVNEKWDEATLRLVDSRISEFKLDDCSCRIELKHGSNMHILELPRNKEALPPHGGSGEIRRWPDDEKVIDAWVVTGDSLHCRD